jgi:queuosine precursor transporter
MGAAAGCAASCLRASPSANRHPCQLWAVMYIVIYLAAIVAANLSVAVFGPVTTPVNALLLIGLDLAVRDRLHLMWRGTRLWTRMLTLIVAGGALSCLVNPASGRIALASVAAFSTASLTSAMTFQLGRRFQILIRANLANLAGAGVDTLVFPVIAFGTVYPLLAVAQFIAKVAGGAVWTWIIFRHIRKPEMHDLPASSTYPIRRL